MKIYQVHEYSGEWEYFRDKLIGSYFSESKADMIKAELEEENRKLTEQSRLCDKCPINNEQFDSNSEAVVACTGYCDNAVIEDYDNNFYCANCVSVWDESTFEVKEIEVE